MKPEYTPKETAVFEAVMRLAGRGVDLAGVKVQQIADEANMGKGTLYEYFKSKEEILHGTVGWCLAQEAAAVMQLTGNARTMPELMELGADYAHALVTRRMAAYQMIAGVLHADAADAPPCGAKPLLQGLQALLGQDYRMAKATGWLADDVEEAYFRHVLFTAMVSYAMVLAGLAKEGCLTAEAERTQRSYFKRMLCACLQTP